MDFKTEARQPIGQHAPRLRHQPAGTLDVRLGLRLERRKACAQGAGIDAPGWPHPFHCICHLGGCKQVAQAQARHRVVFGHGAQDDQVAVSKQRFAAPALVDEGRVRLVEHQQPTGLFIEQMLDLCLPAIVASWIVRIAHEQCTRRGSFLRITDLDRRPVQNLRAASLPNLNRMRHQGNHKSIKLLHSFNGEPTIPQVHYYHDDIDVFARFY